MSTLLKFHTVLAAASSDTTTRQIIGTADTILNIIFIMVGVALVVAVVYFKFIAPQKKKKDGFSEEKKKNGKIENSRIFLSDVEDIRDGIVVTDHGTRFLAAIKCGGYSFFSDTANGQYHTMNSYQSFFKAINGPITYRSSSKMIDAEKPIKKYTERIEELKKRLDDTAGEIEKHAVGDITRQRLESEYVTLAETIEHLSEQLHAIKFYSSSDTISDTYQCYIFEWKYKESDYKIEMTPDDIFAVAKAELYNKGGSYISILANAHIHAKLLNQNEMLELFRRQSRPVTAEIFPLKDYDRSSFYDDIVSSDSLKKKLAEAREEIAANVSREIDKAYDLVKARRAKISGGGEVSEQSPFEKNNSPVNEKHDDVAGKPSVADDKNERLENSTPKEDAGAVPFDSPAAENDAPASEPIRPTYEEMYGKGNVKFDNDSLYSREGVSAEPSSAESSEGSERTTSESEVGTTNE